MNKKKIGRYLLFAAILIILSFFIPEINLVLNPQESTPISGDLDVYFLDVGQGDSTFIRTPEGNTILIDGGERPAGDIILDFLKDQGVDKIDVVIATHAHADHIGGLIDVIENIDVGSVYMPEAPHTTKTFERFVLAVKEKGLKFKSAHAGVNIPLEDVKVRFVGPIEKENYDDLNNSSAVLRLVYGEVGFIFTGDAEVESEEEMLSSGQNLSAQVLKVGHHGSSTSTSEDFLKAVSPAYGIISCGEDNKYGHPHREILKILEEYDVSIHRTDQDGTVHILCDGKQITVR